VSNQFYSFLDQSTGLDEEVFDKGHCWSLEDRRQV